MKIGAILIGVLSFMSFAQAKDFAVGQVWEYKTRAVEPNSFLTIVKIENVKDKTIIHISLENVKIKNSHAPSGYGESVSHMPIAKQSLKESVTKLLKSNAKLPAYEEGYNLWREAFEKGEGGYFTISVSKCIEFMEQTINK